jgi:hypothetical protein
VAPGGRRVPDTPVVEDIDGALPPQGYRLEVADDAVRLTAADDDGRRHGRATLAQLRHTANAPHGRADGRLPACRIEDWPDLAVRGVMIDVSRDRVPTVATLRALVDRLAGWKMNQLQLYMEHTFAYPGHEDVWRHADPYTVDDLQALETHCRTRGVELVANQNTLGHFERWLRLERYRPLAIAPDGFEWMHGIRRPPLTLDPSNPEALALVAGLLGALVPALSSRRVHIGMDEPWELPADRRQQWTRWLHALRALPALDGRELLVWGDVLAAHPDLVPQLPEGVTVCEWGYEEDHPFEERVGRLADAGVPFWVCPGTSSWLSVAGRVDNMLGNIRGAARAGVAYGARGLLVTDWGDMGHHQQPPVSDPGFATAAALAWCASTHNNLDTEELGTVLDAHCYDDPAGVIGHAVVGMGRVAGMVTPHPPNMSALALHLLLPQWRVGGALTRGLSAVDLDGVEAVVDDAHAATGRAGSRRDDAVLLSDEVCATATLLQLACHDARLRLAGDGTLASIARFDREALVSELDAYVEEHRRLWLTRFRPGGLTDSTAWFDHLRNCYRTGTAEPSWFGPYG